ncbi:MAG: 2-oxo acid dehydrogenase subunit E2 [Acidobacteria bacterium]|nr:2-oxo acid dehydrogenase subunit E2 [Acidobacteriota bacterium]
MATDFNVPELGENITAGDVVRLLVKAGDAIAKDQPVLELETDKATIEVPSTVAGTITGIAVKQGDKVKVGQLILRVEEGAPKPPAKEAAPKADAAPAPAAQPVSTAEGAEGAEAAPRATTPQPQQSEGAREPSRKVVDISRGARQPAAAAAAVDVPADIAPVPAAPSVRRMARELGVDIRRVQGSGPAGRISEQDVKAFVRARPAAGGAEPAPLPDLAKWGEVERKPMSNIRRKTAEHLTAAWAAPHVTQHDQADITALEDLRKQYAPRAEAAGGKLTITAIAVKVIAEAMKRFPQFNASIDLPNDQIVYRRYINVGVAVDTERGLLVPVVRDADRKTIVELSVEVAAAAKKARDRKLAPDDMAGGGMSITNLGGIGGTSFTPIINAPEVAILGLSRAEMRPVWRPAGAGGTGGSFEPRLMLPLSLSYDHRVIDGADAARFLRWVCEALEQPLLLVL